MLALCLLESDSVLYRSSSVFQGGDAPSVSLHVSALVSASVPVPVPEIVTVPVPEFVTAYLPVLFE